MKFDLEVIKVSAAANNISSFIFKITIIEKLDQINSVHFETAMLTLIAGGMRKLLLDFSETDYIDSSGIGKIINITKIIRKAGGNITITQCPEKIIEIFRLVKLQTFIKIFLSNDEGINYLRFV